MTNKATTPALVSIIIPACNTAEYIHRAIESSLRQTHTKIEIIIIDDGSTDNTLEIAQSYADKDDRVNVLHQENKGVSSARNYGIHEAKGKYIMFLDSDDWLEDFAVDFLLGEQSKFPDMLVTADAYIWRSDDGKLYRTNDTSDIKIEVLGCEEAIKKYSETYVLASSCFKIFDAENLRRNKIMFRENITHHEDGLFMLEYIYTVKGLVYSSKKILNYFYRPGSATRHSYTHKQASSIMEAFDIMINYPQNSSEVRKAIILHHINADINLFEMALCNMESCRELRYLQDNMKHYADDLWTSDLPEKTKKKYQRMAFAPAVLIKYIAFLQRITRYPIKIAEERIKKIPFVKNMREKRKLSAANNYKLADKLP